MLLLSGKEKMTQCRSCSSCDLVFIGSCPPPVHYGTSLPDSTNLYRCRICHLIQRDPIPSGGQLIEMYRAETSDALDYESSRNAAWQVALKHILAHAERTKHNRILDIGCHTGRFLSLIPSDSFIRFGIEAAGAPSRLAQQTNHVSMIAERVEAVPQHFNHTFDVVTLFDVLEHLPDPAKGLRDALRLVKPGGLLLFSTADADSFTWSQLGSQHWYLQTGQHLSVLSRRYIHYLKDVESLRVELFMLIPHTLSSWSVRFRQILELLHWANRNRPYPWRLIARFLQELPGCRALRHRQRAPWTMSLRDHMFVVIRAGQ